MSQARLNNLYLDHLKSDFSILKSKLDNVFIVNDITSDDKKRAYLITSLCDDTYKLLASLSVPKQPDELKFSELIVLLEKHFKPAISYFASRRKFYYAKQGHEESVREFAARLRSLAGECGFKSSELELLSVISLSLDLLRLKYKIGSRKKMLQVVTLPSINCSI